MHSPRLTAADPRAEMERTFTAERAVHAQAVAQAAGRMVGRLVAHVADKIEYAQLLKAQGQPRRDRGEERHPEDVVVRYLGSATSDKLTGVSMDRASFDKLPPLLPVPTAAILLGLKRASAYRYAAQGELPVQRLGGRVYIVTARIRHLLITDDAEVAA